MTESADTIVRCTKCGAAFSCQPGPECWCAKLPHQSMAEEAEGCLCPTCLKRESATATNARAD